MNIETGFVIEIKFFFVKPWQRNFCSLLRVPVALNNSMHFAKHTAVPIPSLGNEASEFSQTFSNGDAF